jgi:Flp pilus assembly pilin Flp
LSELHTRRRFVAVGRLMIEEAGQAMVEYALILALTTVVAIVALQALGVSVSGFLERTSSSLSSVANP